MTIVVLAAADVVILIAAMCSYWRPPQGLRTPVTDIYRLRSSDQRLYLHILPAAINSSSCTVLGGLKIGRKKLFLHRVSRSWTAINE